MIVKAIPIHRLCEYQGGKKPKGYRRDCYNDVDETEFACKERKRIMVSYDADAQSSKIHNEL